MKRIITLLLLILSTAAFSQERLIKIINDVGGPQNWRTITTQRFTYYSQGEVKTIQDNAYDTTGVNIYMSTLRRYYYNNDGQVDSMAQLRIPQPGDTSLSYYIKYFYTNMLLDSTSGIGFHNGVITEVGANKYTYQNGLQTRYWQYGYDSGYGYFLAHKEDYLYDVNDNRINEMQYWGYLDQDLNYSYTDTLYVRMDHYYSNVSRKDSSIESATEMNSLSDIVELTPRHKTIYKYTQADSLARQEYYYYTFDINPPQHYFWDYPLVNNFLYNNDNYLDKWNIYFVSDSLQGSIATTSKYYRSANNRLDSIYGGHSTIAGGFDLNTTTDLARTIFIYSADEGEINCIPDLIATSFAAYPNPFNGFFTIETNNTEKKNIVVFDMNGKVISNLLTADKKYVYDARALPAGTYSVSVATQKGTVVKTIVKTE